MADEDKIQKQMEFIVRQRAQFASDIGQLQNSIGQLQNSIGQLQDVVTRLANASFQRMDNLENKISSLVDAQIKTEGSLVHLDGKVSSLLDVQIKTEEKLGVLTQAQGNTDKRLDALMSMFERYINKGQNGNSQS